MSVGEEDLIAWRFVSDWASGGRLDLRLRPGSAAAVVQPGDGLWLTRSAWIGEPPAGGGVTLGLRVERVERSAAGTRVVARDALGILAATFARRPFQIDPARFTLEEAVDALICWAGLRPVRAVTMAGAPPLFQWQGGESGLAALRRLLRGQAVILRARVAAPGDPPTICVCAPEGATSATYGAYGAAGVQPIVQRVRVEDSSPPRLAVVQGALTRFAPAAGEEWALAHLSGATTGPSPAVRARPLYLLNRNLEGAEQSAIAGALRCALEGRQTRDLLIAQPHVALELDDRISVEGVESLVARIDERWERGRFVQRLDLGG